MQMEGVAGCAAPLAHHVVLFSYMRETSLHLYKTAVQNGTPLQIQLAASTEMQGSPALHQRYQAQPSMPCLEALLQAAL
jgi:hypothetical protein